MLLDPLEEQFDLPATAIQFGDSEGRKGEVVAQKNQCLSRLGILETDPPERGPEALVGVENGQHNSLIADQPRRAVDRMRVATLDLAVGLASDHEEAAALVNPMQPLEIEIARSMM